MEGYLTSLHDVNSKTPPTDAQVDVNLRDQLEGLRVAPTYAVSRDMLDIINFAAWEVKRPDGTKGMPAETVEREDIPSSFGFVYLPQPIPNYDAHNKLINVRALLWVPMVSTKGNPGLMLSLYGHVDDEDDYTPKIRDWHTRFAPMTKLSLVHLTPVIFGLSVTDLDHYDFGKFNEHPEEIQRIVQEEVRLLSWLKTFWSIVRQEIVTSPRVILVPRAERRRAEKVQASPEVTLVTLRRRHHEHEEPEEDRIVNWSHRWLVGAHWALRHTKLGDRYVWIMPYVKGPESKPLVLKEKVYKLSR